MDRLQLSADARALLQEGISVVLSRWASLQLAIENERGGRNSSEKALKLASDIFIWFTQTKGELYIDDLENLLDKAMLSLNTKVADGSIEKVSYELMSVHEECLGGNRMDELQLSPDAKALFQEGISMVLSRWSSLQLAIENEWGGRNSREKALKLASDIFIWFTQTKGELYIDDLENLLDEAMLSLNTEVDDGSIEEVSYELMSMHEECLGGNYDIIQRLRASTSQARPVQHVRQVPTGLL